MLVLPGCSLLQTTYNNATTLTYLWLDSYLDFNKEQTPAVKSALVDLHEWHRQQELPLYADFVQKLQQSALRDIEPDTVCQAFAEVRLRTQVFAGHILPVTIAATSKLSNKQLAYLEKQFAKRNKKWREEWMEVTPSELVEHRLEESIDRAEKFYGRLQDAQVNVIKDSIAASSLNLGVIYREILRRQSDTLATLRAVQAETDEALIAAELSGLIERSIHSPNPQYVSHFNTITKEGCQTLARLHNTTSPEQRAKASKTLEEYASIFRQLSARQVGAG